MLAITLGMVLVPASILVVWFGMPPIKTLMTDLVSGWGATVGLSGIALAIANAMPIIVPIACIGMMIAGFLGLIKGRSSSV